jgi:jouberin
MRLEFSNNGKYLAAACTQKDSRTIIKIFEVEDENTCVFRYRGHSNIIHSLEWSDDDNYLISSSSDCSVKIWCIPESTNNEILEEESETTYLIDTLLHPAYVYCARFHPESRIDKLMIATACVIIFLKI